MKRGKSIGLFVKITLVILVFVVVALVFYGDYEISIQNPISSFIKKERAIKLIFVGDMMLSRRVGMKMASLNDYNYPFKNVAEFLSLADVTFGNLENPVSSRGVKVGSIYSFRADPKTVEGLKFAGFDVVSLANNHIWDYSKTAFIDTLDILASSSIGFVGAGRDYYSVHSPWTKEIEDTKIAYLAYTDFYSENLSAKENIPGISFYVEKQMVEDIINAKKSNDIIVVSFHTGDEYQTYHNAKQEKIFHLAIDSGADIIIGHHSHVVQDVEQYNSQTDGHAGWIAYSLGNFIFDQDFSEETMSGLIIEVTLLDKKVIEFKKIPTKIDKNFQVNIVSQ